MKPLAVAAVVALAGCGRPHVACRMADAYEASAAVGRLVEAAHMKEGSLLRDEIAAVLLEIGTRAR